MNESRFQLVDKLGKGSFGDIFKGIDKKTNQYVAIKIEYNKKGNINQNGEEEGQLKHENSVYRDFRNVKIHPNLCWPQVLLCGSDGKGQTVLVMDLLGPNLDNILQKYKPLSESTFRALAVKMIHLIELFHGKGYVHRDLKPQNFCVNKDKTLDEIFLIDYGLAKKFKNKGIHIPFAQKRSLKGTIRYSSINVHLGVEQSRRDDMAALGYIFVYMLTPLPWQSNPKDTETKEQLYTRVMLTKMENTFEELVQDIEEPIKTILLTYIFYVNSLLYEETPNYQFCKSLFIERGT